MLERMEFEEFLPQGTHMGLLSDLMERDGMRQQDLAIATIKDKGTVARALNQLEEAQLIERRMDPNDRRQKHIYLTEKAHRLWHYAAERARRTIDIASQEITPEDMRTCVKVLQKMYTNLHDELSHNEKE